MKTFWQHLHQQSHGLLFLHGDLSPTAAEQLGARRASGENQAGATVKSDRARTGAPARPDDCFRNIVEL